MRNVLEKLAGVVAFVALGFIVWGYASGGERSWRFDVGWALVIAALILIFVSKRLAKKSPPAQGA